MTGPPAGGPDDELLAGLDPARFAAALSVLPINHPLVVAASLAVETAHTRHDRRTAHQQISRDISAGADWSRIAAQHIPHAELQARRAQPAYPTDLAHPKESVVTEQSRRRSLSATADRFAEQEAMAELVRCRAAVPGYVMVGPSARTWLRDPTTGLPAVEVSDAEHRAVRELVQQERADIDEPRWVTGSDGQASLHTTVTLTDADPSPGSVVDDGPIGAVTPEQTHREACPDLGGGVVTREQATARMVEAGHNRADAETMVGEYLAANTARWGEPAGGWVIDTHDLAEIERSYEWVDHFRGETIAAARERAADYAEGWARTAPHVDREHSPDYASFVDRQVRTWTDRAAGTPVRSASIYSEDPDSWAVEQDAQAYEQSGITVEVVSDPRVALAGSDLAAQIEGGPDRDGRGPDLPDIAPDLATRSPETTARDLASVVPDVDLPRARELVDAYLDQTADRAGVPTAGWGLDRYDLDVIAAEQRVAAAHDAVAQTSTGPTPISRPAEEATEQVRRAQLATWAATDTTDDHADEQGSEQLR